MTWKKITTVDDFTEDVQKSDHPLFKTMREEMAKFHALDKHSVFCNQGTCLIIKGQHEAGDHSGCTGEDCIRQNVINFWDEIAQ